MPSKLQFYTQMTDHTARQVTGSFGEWTAFLETAGRLYKYPFHEQLNLADFVRCYESVFLYLLAKNNNVARQSETQKLKQSIDASERRIEVRGKDKETKKVKVDIYFTAVGLFTPPTEQELQTAMEEIRQNPQQFRISA